MKSLAVLLALAAAILALPGDAAAQSGPRSLPDGLTDRQKEEVRELIGEHLRGNPEIILEAIQILQQREQARQNEQQRSNLASNRRELERDPTSPVGGNPKGDITVVEFFDYRCGFCKQVLPAIQELLRTDGDIRWVFKEFPILSPASRLAAKAALAAWNQDRDKYMDFHIALMESPGGLSERDILRMAGNVGLDPEAIKAGLNDPAVEQALQRNSRLAERLGISGTPGFVIGDQVVPGAIDLRTMRQMIKELRERS